MEEKELRIGSTYLSVKFNVPVKLTAEDISELVRIAEGASISHYIDEMFKPILLTEEWFVKFGFEIKSLLFTLGDFDAGLNEDDFVKNQFTLRYKRNLWIKVKYVHQLQNLYSVLTEKELKINA